MEQGQPITKGRSALERFYPEIGVGGFSSVDGTVQFYTRVNALLEPDMTVVDFGAGRGVGVLDDSVPFRRKLRQLKGKVRKVIGLDIDPVVQTNPSLDEAHVTQPGSPLPLEDESVDLIVSDYTFEHIEDPGPLARELSRILKPGGWLCSRTPHKWGYISVGARLIPNRLHTGMLRKLQPGRKSEDIFPTTYRLNTQRAIRAHFPENEFAHFVYTWNPEPAYFADSTILLGLMKTAFRIMPDSLGAVLFIFLQKRGAQRANGKSSVFS